MVSNATLVVFRILFGLLMAVESFGAIGTGWVRRTFVDPGLTFPHMGFGFLRALSGPWMTGYFFAMGTASLGVMLGYRYRASAGALAALWTGAYFAQTTHYNNHYYLAVILAWGMVFLPAHQRASLDVRAGRAAASAAVAGWIPRAFRLQVGIVFTFAAIAKLEPGWWTGDFLKLSLGARGDRWLVGPLLVESWFQKCIAYSGLGFDALVVPGLLWRRTRTAAFVALVGFNLFNSLVFQIGIFPYMVLALALFFFEPATVERAFGWLPGLSPGPEEQASATGSIGPGLRALLGLILAVQIALPFRHHLFPGDVSWTDEGHRMSWRMMLRAKSGTVTVRATDPATGRVWHVDLERFLSPVQIRRVATRPDMMFRFARDLRAHYAAEGIPDVEIRAARSRVALNGAPPEPLYDPNIDLASAPWDPFGHDAWVLRRGESGD